MSWKPPPGTSRTLTVCSPRRRKRPESPPTPQSRCGRSRRREQRHCCRGPIPRRGCASWSTARPGRHDGGRVGGDAGSDRGQPRAAVGHRSGGAPHRRRVAGRAALAVNVAHETGTHGDTQSQLRPRRNSFRGWRPALHWSAFAVMGGMGGCRRASGIYPLGSRATCIRRTPSSRDASRRTGQAQRRSITVPVGVREPNGGPVASGAGVDDRVDLEPLGRSG